MFVTELKAWLCLNRAHPNPLIECLQVFDSSSIYARKADINFELINHCHLAGMFRLNGQFTSPSILVLKI